MATLTIELDALTESALKQISQREGDDVTHVASRLLARAVRAARPRPAFNTEAVKAANAPFEAEDEALAESGGLERAGLLAQEDAA